MAGISAISGVSGSYNYYGAISSGKRINKAADDASSMAISEKLKSEGNAHEANQYNDKAAQGVFNIADGALSGVHDYLQRIKELSVKAANGTNSMADKQAIQSEISQYLEGIDQIAGTTQFNGMNILDGSNKSLFVASNPDGSGHTADMGISTVEALGLKGYDVTGKFDMSKVDSAIDFVSKQRSGIGASSNAIMSAYNYSVNAGYNLTDADSRLEDLDIPKAVSEKKKQELLDSYQMMMQRRHQDDQASLMNRMLMGM